jgi:methane monooxygenase component A beta chain/propane monooxygenase small subunit
MTEKTATTRRRSGRPKPIPFTYIPLEDQKEYYELSLNGSPSESEAMLGGLTGFYDTGGYIFGRYPSRLVHPNWRQFRDPDRYTFRSYNNYLAEQAAIVTHGTETLLATGYLECMDPGWQEALSYLAAFRFHEAGALKLWQFVQYAAASEPISYCGVEECGSRLISVHTLNRYALDLAHALPGWNDDNALELWLEDGGALAGAREYVEHELTIRDWAEGILVDAVVAGPLYYEPILRFFAINGAAHGDVSTPTIVSSFTALAERRLRWAKEFVRLALEVEENRPVIEEWLGQWTPRAEAALDALGPLYERVPNPVLKAGVEADRARSAYDAVVEELGLGTLTGVTR